MSGFLILNGLGAFAVFVYVVLIAPVCIAILLIADALWINVLKQPSFLKASQEKRLAKMIEKNKSTALKVYEYKHGLREHHPLGPEYESKE